MGESTSKTGGEKAAATSAQPTSPADDKTGGDGNADTTNQTTVEPTPARTDGTEPGTGEVWDESTHGQNPADRPATDA